ncbi:hypothetical protein KSP40_PGU009199 [Platanthera guangdongensis]|uniref:Uncharacterized protein n=1 Tax=Platanthera guangdongensis TaxID=2320717 RepID=A0ABR2LHA8_9ASPA
MHQKTILLLLAAAVLITGAGSQADSSEKCTCLPCGTPCPYSSPPPPEPEYYPPPPPEPEYYSPPPPSPPPPVPPAAPSQPCPPPPSPPAAPTTPSNPCCSPSTGATPYFGLVPPGQLYPQDPNFSPSMAYRRLEGRLQVFSAVFGLISLWW